MIDLGLLAVGASLGSSCIVNLEFMKGLKFVGLGVDFKGSGMCADGSFYFI